MKLEYLKLKNFRQFLDVKIDFLVGKGNKNIIIIEGESDTGKTTLLNAITWCLYGEEHHIKIKESGIINNLKWNEAKDGDVINIEVEIGMRDKKENSHTFIRTYKSLKHPSKEYSYFTASKIKAETEFSYLKNETIFPESFKEEIFPKEISEYFFFDGEQIDRYFEKKLGTLKDAVMDVSQINILKRTIERIKGKKSDMVDNLGENIKTNYGEEIRGKEKELEEANKTLMEFKTLDKSLKKKINRIGKELEDYKGSENIENDRKDLLEKKNMKKKEIDEAIKEDLLDEFIKKSSRIYFEPSFDKSLKILEKNRNLGIIPIKERNILIDNILKRNECICGEHINKKRADCLKEEKNKSEKFKEIDEIAEKIKFNIQKMKEEFPEIKENLSKERNRINKMKEEYDKLENDFNKIEKIYAKISGKIKYVKEKHIERKDLEERRDNNNRIIGTKEGEIKRLEKIKDYMEDKEEEEIKKFQKNKSVKAKFDLLRDTQEYGERIMKEIVEETRSKIEKQTKENFLKLHWKKNAYKGVEISEDYEIIPLDKFGNDDSGKISKGTTHILALSFIAALNSVSGFESPIIIDSPLGKLSPLMQNNVAENIDKFLPGKQLIFLVTGSEYNSKVRNILKNRVEKEYTLKYIEKKLGNYIEVKKYV